MEGNWKASLASPTLREAQALRPCLGEGTVGAACLEGLGCRREAAFLGKSASAADLEITEMT